MKSFVNEMVSKTQIAILLSIVACSNSIFEAAHSFPSNLPFTQCQSKRVKLITTTSIRSESVEKEINLSPNQTISKQGLPSIKEVQRQKSTRNGRSGHIDSDRRLFAFHLLACYTTARTLISYENYDCANLKPQQAALKPSSTKGLAYGKLNRMEGRREILGAYESTDDMNEKDESLWDIPSYNEVMLQHRSDRVPRWKSGYTKHKNNNDMMLLDAIDDEFIKEAINESLFSLLKLKTLAKDYNWDDMRIILKSQTLNENLEKACSMLRFRLLSRQNSSLGSCSIGSLGDEHPASIIGFDWGSCAWRHCGALADIQESLAELTNSLGLFEPFECLFVLDIAERSLRDIIAIIPDDFNFEKGKLPNYEPYKPQVSLLSMKVRCFQLHRSLCIQTALQIKHCMKTK